MGGINITRLRRALLRAQAEDPSLVAPAASPLLAWPVGCVMFTAADKNPTTTCGGTWVSHGHGAFPSMQVYAWRRTA